jgi:heat shock protein HtpX
MMPLGLQMHRALDRTLRLFGLSSNQEFSPEETLLEGPIFDPRLTARAPMSNHNLDVGVLGELSRMGMKRAKEVTDESHPELMDAWRKMATRAGLKKAPQLIIADSDTLNALTFSKQEVAITTGLLKILDLRETAGVLAHELGHAQSDHTTPRLAATGALAGGGLMLGNHIGHSGGIISALSNRGITFKWLDWIHAKIGFVRGFSDNRAASALGYLAYMGIGASAGSVIANHFTVRPTELDADMKGAAISGDPLGLALALRKLEVHSSRGGLRSNILWALSGYPSTEARIMKLEQLALLPQANARLVDSLPVAAAAPMQAQPAAQLQEVASSERMRGTPVKAVANAVS